MIDHEHVYQGSNGKYGKPVFISTMQFTFKVVFLALTILIFGTLLLSCSRTSTTVVIEARADVVEESFEYSGIDELQGQLS